jgi:hypothetical protein
MPAVLDSRGFQWRRNLCFTTVRNDFFDVISFIPPAIPKSTTLTFHSTVMNQDHTDSHYVDARVEECRRARVLRYEMVTIAITHEDHDELKKSGGPRADQIHMALRHYLKMLNETGWRPTANGVERMYSTCTIFQCAVRKDLCDEIRDLGGRFDAHTMEAVRLFLL